MTDRRILLLAIGGALLTASAPLVRHDVLRDAPPPAHTGGFGEPTCLTCHMGDANDPRGALEISAPAYYTPGATYEIRVRLKHPELAAGGFELSVRDTAGRQAGRFITDTASVAVTTLNDVLYVHHVRASTRPTGDSISWSFDWVAPDNTNPLVIHVAANAGNDDESPLGDFVYVRSDSVAGVRDTSAGGRSPLN